MFKPEVYRIEGSTVTLLGRFGAPAMIRRPHSDSTPGELCPPCPTRYAPVWK